MRANARAMAVLMVCGVGLLGCPGSERNAAAMDADAVVEVAVIEEDAGIVDEDAGIVDEDMVVVDEDMVAFDDGPATPPPDSGIRMTFTFVSAALVSAPGSAIQMNAQISWHGSLHGSAGGVTFHGTIH